MTATLGLMDHHPPDVVSLAEHVESRLGDACCGLKLVADRRGSRVYRLRFPTGDVALKLATHNAEEQGVREAEHLARREAAVLTHLHDFTPGYLIDSGDLDGGGSWLALRWLEGSTPHWLFTPARHGDDSPTQRDTIIHTALNVADRLAALMAPIRKHPAPRAHPRTRGQNPLNDKIPRRPHHLTVREISHTVSTQAVYGVSRRCRGL